MLSLARPFLAFLRGLGFSSTSCRFCFLGFGLGRFPALPPPPPDGLERCAAPASPPSESESDSDESEITTQSMLAFLHSSARTKQQEVPKTIISSRSRWLCKVVAPDFGVVAALIAFVFAYRSRMRNQTLASCLNFATDNCVLEISETYDG